MDHDTAGVDTTPCGFDLTQGVRSAGPCGPTDEHMVADRHAQHRRLEGVSGESEHQLDRLARRLLTHVAGRVSRVECVGVDDLREHQHRSRTTIRVARRAAQWLRIEHHLGFEARVDDAHPAGNTRSRQRPSKSGRSGDALVGHVEHPRGRSRHGEPLRRRTVGGDDRDDAHCGPVAQQPVETHRRLPMGDVIERVPHGGEAVDHHHDRRQAACVGGAAVELVGKAGKQSSEPFELRHPHHSAAVGECVERQPRRVALRVDHVQLQRLGARSSCAGRRHGDCCCRRARTDRADEHQVAGVRFPAQRSAALVGRVVEQPDRSVILAEVARMHHRGQRVDPRTVGAGTAHHRRRASDRIDDVFQHAGPTCEISDSWRARRRYATDVFDSQAAGARRQRPRRARGLEHHEIFRAESQRGSSRCADGKAGRGGVADHVVGIGAILQTERDAQVGVGTDVVGDHPRRPLRRQQQMDAEAASALGDRHERPEEAGEFLGERRELVDHHHQARQRVVDGAPVAREVVDTDGAQQTFSTAHLGVEADEHTLGEAVIEVGHHTNRVRQPGTGVERRASLVIDQDHRHVVGSRLHGERRDQCAQQFALARPGGACDQPVRTIAHQVDVDDTVGRHPENSHRCRVASGLHPSASDHRRCVVGERFEFGERHNARYPAGAVMILGIDQRRQATSSGFRGRRGHTGDRDVLIRRRPRRAVGFDTPGGSGVAEFEDAVDDRRHRRLGCDEDDARAVAAGEPTAYRTRARTQQLRDVEHDHGAPPRSDVAAGLAVDVAFDPLHSVGQRDGVGGGDHCRAMAGLGQPADPAPPIRVAGDHLEFPVGRPVGGCQLHDHRTAQRSPDRERAVKRHHR